MATPDHPKEWLTVPAIAAELDITPESIRRVIANRQLVAYRIGRGVKGSWRVRRTDYEAWLAKARNVQESQLSDDPQVAA